MTLDEWLAAIHADPRASLYPRSLLEQEAIFFWSEKPRMTLRHLDKFLRDRMPKLGFISNQRRWKQRRAQDDY